nr:hypothetical protein [Ruminococcus sp.]
LEMLGQVSKNALEHYAKIKEKKLRLTLHVTSLCNFACPYCFQNRRSGNMPKEVKEQILRYAEKRLSEGGSISSASAGSAENRFSCPR